MNKKTLIIIIIILILGVFVSMKWENIYYEGLTWITFFKHKPSICDKIRDQEKKDSCYLGLAEYNPDLSICDKIKNQEQKDSCYANIAISTLDLSICDKAQDPFQKSLCYSDVAASKQDLSICEKIEDQQKGNCYGGVAASKQDLSICDKIKNQGEKDWCYINISWAAFSNEDSSICDKIKDQEWRKDSCYLTIAVFEQDLPVCDKIQDQKWKDICYRNVAARGGQFQTIKQIKEKYESELMAIEGVVGVGIGKCDDKFCIKVFLENDSSELKKRIPKRLDGLKVVTEVTGPIEALPK